MATWAPIIAGAGTSIFGSILQRNAERRRQEEQERMNRLLQTISQFGLDRSIDWGNPLRDLLLGQANAGQTMLWGGGENGPGMLPTMWGQGSDWLNNGLMQLFRDSGQYWTPEQGQSIEGMMGAINQGRPITDIAAQVFRGGGWSPQGQNLFDRGFDMLNGQGWESRLPADIGGDLLGLRGQSAFSQEAQNRAGQAYSGLLGAGLSDMSGNFGIGGLTPTGAVGEGTALQGLLQGGGTPLSQFLSQHGAEVAGQEPLLPLPLIMSMAREGASQDINQRAGDVYRRAQARGGGPGSVLGAGVRNNMYADFADQAAMAQSAALRDALTKQQGLRLQESELGTRQAESGGQLENQRLSTLAQLLSNLENAATARYRTGGDFLSQVGQQGIPAMNAETTRMGLGGSLMDQYNRMRLGSLSTLGDILGRQNQFALGGGQLALGGANQEANIWNSIFQRMLGAGELGNQRAMGMAGAWNQGFGNLGNLTSLAGNQINATLNPWASALNAWLGLSSGVLGGQRNPYSGNSPIGNTLGQIGQNLTQFRWPGGNANAGGGGWGPAGPPPEPWGYG